MFTLGILTVSTSRADFPESDTSGNVIRELLSSKTYCEMRYEVVRDDRILIEECLKKWCDEDGLDLIVTTGGTGIGPQDVTPEACLAVIEKEIPGIAEIMRMETFAKTQLSILSRSVVGIRGGSLIVTLPGNPKGVGECLQVIEPILPHALDILKGKTTHHSVDG
jgi:molybdenum cofactor synthesis domain-containing protein